MFYKNEKGRVVHLLNTKPRNLSAGGMITGHPPKKDEFEDTVLSQLEYGSLVIPRPVVRSGIMDLYKGPILGPKCNDPTRLGPTIVMPKEIVVHRSHAAGVEKFLASHGIHLPLPPNFDVSKIISIKK